jgi:hypothetical protein
MGFQTVDWIVFIFCPMPEPNKKRRRTGSALMPLGFWPFYCLHHRLHRYSLSPLLKFPLLLTLKRISILFCLATRVKQVSFRFKTFFSVSVALALR